MCAWSVSDTHQHAGIKPPRTSFENTASAMVSPPTRKFRSSSRAHDGSSQQEAMAWEAARSASTRSHEVLAELGITTSLNRIPNKQYSINKWKSETILNKHPKSKHRRPGSVSEWRLHWYLCTVECPSLLRLPRSARSAKPSGQSASPRSEGPSAGPPRPRKARRAGLSHQKTIKSAQKFTKSLKSMRNTQRFTVNSQSVTSQN